MRPQRIGDAAISKIVDFEAAPWKASDLFPEVTPAMLAATRLWVPPGFLHPEEDVIFLSFHSYVLRTPRQTMLIDTCVGNCKERASLPSWHRKRTPYLEELARNGLRPEDIDIVLCTHLHADHVGWNTRLENERWVPTFPNARYVMGRTEFDHWAALHRANPPVPVTRGAFADSVLPVVESGQSLLVEADHVLEGAIGEGVWLESSPGHSPGHVSVHVRYGAAHAVFSGDVIHSPLQCDFPDLCSAADVDRALSRKARQRLLERLADTSTLLLAAHFGSSTAGVIKRNRDTFRFQLQ